MTSLHTLEMQSTSITSLPAVMAELPSLRRLEMKFSTKLDKAAVRAMFGKQVEIDA
jgi:hypothetical protein